MSEPLPDRVVLVGDARDVLTRHWRAGGYAVPNLVTYPHQWLWDSCFHAVCWAHLGEAERALSELRTALAHQDADGFVPHMTYWNEPDQHAAFWGRPRTSCITQPPMYGHAVAELIELGIAVDDELRNAVRRGVSFVAGRRADRFGLPIVVHPWETGCDDSPRWDAWCDDGRWSAHRWRECKGDLVKALVLDAQTRSPVSSRSFVVESVAFAALTAFNAQRLQQSGIALPDVDVARLIGGLRACWDARTGTFGDLVHVGTDTSSHCRTLEALLPVLVLDPSQDAAIIESVFAQLRDPAAFGGVFGPAQVHRDEPAFDPDVYWRGPAWPQLAYLFWLAASRLGRDDDASFLADALVRGAAISGFAEYWNPDTGAALGAVPQSWTALAAVVS